jgi:hypothetical protein
MIELVIQTGAIRDFMEESMTALTEVRKVQVDVKREWKKVYVNHTLKDSRSIRRIRMLISVKRIYTHWNRRKKSMAMARLMEPMLSRRPTPRGISL